MNMNFRTQLLQGEALHNHRIAMRVIEGMRCDFSAAIICVKPVSVSPRIFVPSRTQMAPGHANLKMTTTLHYCEEHVGTLKVEEFLTDKVKANFEAIAKQKRPIDFKCDFDNAFIHYVSVFTPEYQAYLAALDRGLAERFGGVPYRG